LFSTLIFLGKENKYAILILAAGESKRLGRPKQLVPWKGSTLLNHTIDQALAVGHSDVFVAVGSSKSMISSIVSENVTLLEISNWNEGMGTSIARSIDHIDTSYYSAIIISVCDQPFISTSIYNDLISAYESGNSTIIISQYLNGNGPPSLFSKVHFRELKTLEGDNGAKRIVKNNLSNRDFVQFEKGYIDIDTVEDLNQLRP